MVFREKLALNLVDKITLLYLTLVGIMILIFGTNLKQYYLFLSFHLFGIIFLMIFYYFTTKFKLNFLRDWYLIFIVTFFYEETGYLNQMIFHGFWDHYIVHIENVLFGFDLGLFLLNSFNNRFINEIMYLAYFSYYLIIPLLGYFIYKKDRLAFHRYLFTLMLCYYICYLLYIFVPIAGPFEFEKIHINGYIFSKIIHFFYKYGELPGSAMPSSHVAIALIVLIYSKINKIKFPLFLIIFILLSISTMYLRFHYFLDVEAGIITGIFSYIISCKIMEKKRLIWNT